MIKYFGNKIKTFFISRSRLTRVTLVLTLLVVVVGIFGFAFPARAADGILESIAGIFANIFLLFASLLGQILVLIIGLLLDIVSYNNFVDAPAVNYGWTVVRDICNLFFVLILLVIGFGSVLRLENFKYNQLLGKLVVMIILVNFSKMIAGFFIDISQVVLMTFTNAFAATAAENFTSALKLKEMLGFISESSGSDVDIAEGFGALEIFGLALLPVALLLVAIFVMLAMVLVFMIRIIMLWILLVLSPLAYLLSVLPSSQQYSKQWWSHFTKWVVTGPVLAFFIWFSLTLIAGGGIDPASFELENQTTAVKIGQETQKSTLAVGVGAVSSSDSILQFIMAIGLLVVSLLTAQSLGGIAGSFSGKMLGKVQGMGSWALNKAGAPLRGAGELAMMGGRKIRREVRDRTPLGAIANIVEGAKQRGKEVESRSKELAVARGRDLYDKRPKSMGGQAEPVSAEMQVRAKFARQAAAEIAPLQKEQKADQLEQLARRRDKNLDNVVQREGMILAMGSEAHIDDAMARDYFQKQHKWSDDYGQEHSGFSFYDVTEGEVDATAKDEGIDIKNEEEREKLRLRLRYDAVDNERTAFRDTESTNHFVSSMVSPTYSTVPEKISESGSNVLYALEQMGLKNKHNYMVGIGKYSDKLRRLARVSDRKEQEKVISSEINKRPPRDVIAQQNHNMSVQHMSPEGQGMFIRGNNVDAAEHMMSQKLTGQIKNDPGEYSKHGLPRHEEMLGKFDDQDKRHQIYNTREFIDSLGDIYRNNPEMASVNEVRVASAGYKMHRRDANGNLLTEEPAMEFADLHDFRKKWITGDLSDVPKDKRSMYEGAGLLPNAKAELDELEKRHKADPSSVTNRELFRARKKVSQLEENWGTESKGYNFKAVPQRKNPSEKTPTPAKEVPETPTPAKGVPETPTPAHEAKSEEEDPTSVPRKKQVIDPAILTRSQQEYQKISELPGLSSEDYDEMHSQQIENGEMLSRDEIERYIQATSQEDVDTMRGTKSVVRAGKSETRQGKTASGAVVVGMNFDDEAVRKRYGISEGADAARYDKSTPEREKSMGIVADRLAEDFAKQLRNQGADESIVGEEVAAFRKALEENQKIVISDNNSTTSRLETVRGHEIRGHDEAQKLINPDGTKNVKGEKFYNSLDKQQKEMADQMGMEEFAAESMGVGKGKYALTDKSKEVLHNEGIKFAGSGAGEDLSSTQEETSDQSATPRKPETIQQQVEQQTEEVADDVKRLKIDLSDESIAKFTEDITKSMSAIEVSDSGLSAVEFEKSFTKLNEKFEKLLAKATPQQKQEIMQKYNAAKDNLEIGKVSDKTIQFRIINALNVMAKKLSNK